MVSAQERMERVVSQAKVEAAEIADSVKENLAVDVNSAFPSGAPAELRQLIDEYRNCIYRQELADRHISPFFEDAEKIQTEYDQLKSRILQPVTAIVNVLKEQIRKKIKITDEITKQVRKVALIKSFLGPDSEQAVAAKIALDRLINRSLEKKARDFAAKSKKELEDAFSILDDSKEEKEEKEIKISPKHLGAIKVLIEKYEQCVYQYKLEKQQDDLKQTTEDEYKDAKARIYNPILVLKSLSESINRKLQSLSCTLDPIFEKSLREAHLACHRDCELAKMDILPDLKEAQEKYKQSLRNLDDLLLKIRKLKAPWSLYIQNQLDQIARLGVARTSVFDAAIHNLFQTGLEWSLAEHGIYSDAAAKHAKYKTAESRLKVVKDDLAKVAVQQQTVWPTVLRPSLLANRPQSVSPIMGLLKNTSCRRS